MFDRPAGYGQPAAFPEPGGQPQPWPDPTATSAAAPITRPSRWSLANWPVRWKVVAIAVVPLLLAAAFGGVRIYSSIAQARDLAVAADRAELVPSINDYMAALENALVVHAADGDFTQAMADYDTRSDELRQQLARIEPVSDVRLASVTLLDYGQTLLDKVEANAVDLRQQVTTFSPLLLTAETAITGSVRVADEELRLQAEGLARAVGARGQMEMQRMLVEAGADLPEPELRASMIALAGTEPSTVRGMAELLGGASDDAAALRSQMVQRLSVLSDPTQQIVDNATLLQSIQTTDDIAQKVVADATDSVTTTVNAEATDARNDAIRDALVVLAVFLIVVLIVILVARSLTRPLRQLRDGALKIAHQDLVREIDRVKAGDESPPEPLPIHTSEELGQVAHAVDELHTQALLLAGDEARLRVTVNDMFETMSRRNKSLVDQQLSLIDRLERNEEDPDRLDSLFRLDHLATRMRRNGANLLVLAGAQVAREQSSTQVDAVPLVSLISAAASEVEEYQRVDTGMVPDCSVIGPVAGDAVHLLAELIDNALQYSPPTEQVRVSAVHTSNGGVLVDVDDAGLGMTDADLRIANMRLNAGGEVSPDSTRHMGLFVVGRLARQHGMTVRLFTPASGSGTTAQLYVPPELLENVTAFPVAPAAAPVVEPAVEESYEEQRVETAAPSLFDKPVGRSDDADRVESDAPVSEDASVTLLPRRTPGTSGITGSPVDESGDTDRGAAFWSGQGEGDADDSATAHAPADTSGFFSSRRRLQRPVQQADQSAVPEPEEPVVQELPPEAAAVDAPLDTGSIDLSEMNRMADELTPHPTHSGPDLIYQNMVSEWLVDPQGLAVPQDWKSVWDNGWAAAAEAENLPVESHTDHGLPVRQPGARLVPGGAAAHSQRNAGPGNATGEGSNGGSGADEQPDIRDPDAIRASISNHFGGVRAGRSHARDTTEGHDHQ